MSHTHVHMYYVLKCEYIETIYTNCMRLETHYDGPNYMLCDSIEEYLRFEQHRSNVAQRVTKEDLSYENQYYGNIIQLNRMNVVN